MDIVGIQPAKLYATVDNTEKFLCDCLVDASASSDMINVDIIYPERFTFNEDCVLQALTIHVAGLRIAMLLPGAPFNLKKYAQNEICFRG